MKRLASVVWFTTLIFVFSSQFTVHSSQSIILLPSDKTITEAGLVNIVVRLAKGSADAIEITINNAKPLSINIDPERGFVCKGIEINFGLNTIKVIAKKEGSIIWSQQVQVFHRSDISRENRVAPPDFKKDTFHIKDKEKTCSSCHRMEVNKRDLSPAKPEDSMCFTCHNKITSFKNVHGPVSVWGCLNCHNPESSPNKYSVKTPVRDICFTCHFVQKEDWATKKYTHGPTATGKCTICHNPHASNNPFWLKKPTWDLCVTCHEDRASGRHVVAGFVYGQSHPTKGVPDPLRPGKELTCASCHNPHVSSNSKSLFNFDVTDRMSLCIVCHKK
ncbi:MAG: hypothetical protein HZC12_08615 [Nitrospirae bacterium]|nr:hypothetical protein [Nitrospirota bacterium]